MQAGAYVVAILFYLLFLSSELCDMRQVTLHLCAATGIGTAGSLSLFTSTFLSLTQPPVLG